MRKYGATRLISIQKVKAYRITQKQLVLLDAQGQELLTFKKE